MPPRSLSHPFTIMNTQQTMDPVRIAQYENQAAVQKSTAKRSKFKSFLRRNPKGSSKEQPQPPAKEYQSPSITIEDAQRGDGSGMRRSFSLSGNHTRRGKYAQGMVVNTESSLREQTVGAGGQNGDGSAPRPLDAASPAQSAQSAASSDSQTAEIDAELVRKRVGKLNAKKSKRRFSRIKFSFGRSSKKVAKKAAAKRGSSKFLVGAQSDAQLSPRPVSPRKASQLSPRKAVASPSPRKAHKVVSPRMHKLSPRKAADRAETDAETIMIRSPKPSPEAMKKVVARQVESIPPIARTLAMYSIDRSQLKSVKVC